MIQFNVKVLLCQDSKANTKIEQIEYYNNLGKENHEKGKMAEALDNFNAALRIAQDINDSAYIAKLYSNIGVIQDLIGNYENALSNYQKSLSIYDKIHNNTGKETVLNNMGVVYEEIDMPQKALANYFMALQIAQQNNSTQKIGGTYNNIAIIYENFLDKSDSAYYFYKKALECYVEIGDDAKIALIKSNIGIVFLRKGDLEKAQKYIDQSIELFQQHGARSDFANSLYFKGKVFMERMDYDSALNYFQQALELTEKFKIKKRQSNILNDMAIVYKEQGNYKLAMTAIEKHMQLKDELMNLEKARQIHSLEMSYYSEKKEHEIELLNTQNELRARELIWTKRLLYSLILIAILAAIIAILNRHKNLLKQKQDLLLLQSRLFRSQTTPHFVFNSLMAIQTFLMEGNIDTASKYLVDFAKLTRSVLQNTQKSLVPLDQEISFIKQYLSLEELRFGDKFDFEFNVNIDSPEEIQFPPMLSQPFIENAIVHGLLPKNKKGLLKVDFYESDKTFFVVIEDNGIGRTKNTYHKKNKDHESMAIEMSRQRLQILAKRFKKVISFSITDVKDENGNAAGTRVVFTMPLE